MCLGYFSGHLDTINLILLQPRNRLRVLLLQMLLPHKQASNKPKRSNARVQDPHVPHTPRKRILDRHLMRRVGNCANKHYIRSGILAGELLHQFRREAGSLQERPPQLHATLEDDAANHNRETGPDTAHEAEGTGRRGGVVLADHRLDSNEGGFEEEAGADSRYDFKADDLFERGSRIEGDEKAVAEGQHRGADIHAFEVAASAMYDHADDNAGQGGRDGDREDEDTRHDGCGGLDGLEISGRR